MLSQHFHNTTYMTDLNYMQYICPRVLHRYCTIQNCASKKEINN
jgi:hypothetical protein